MKYKNFFMVFIASSVLAACTGYVPKPAGQPQLVAEPNSADLMLAEAADRATRALETLAATESAQSPVKTIAAVPSAPKELRRAMTFDWTGPAEALVQELSKKAGYAYNTVGSAPGTPLIVSLKATNKPLIDILRDIGLQLGARADLKIDAQMRRMEIHYAETSNRAGP